ncbi:MAG: hypothetical protein ABSC48_13015 [Terracidiphilus sp.]|jgi:hypothetical protein
MQKIESANQLSGRATGVIVCAGFGALWLFLSLYARQTLSAVTVSGVVLGMLALILAAVLLFREAKRWPRVPEDPAVGRAFGWINTIQWIAVGAVAFTLARLHLDAYIPSAITAIVGLHMFPLARIFRYTAHYRAGAILLAWALASVLFVPVDDLQGITALGTGLILWLSAALTLTLAFKAARQSVETQAC